MAFKMKRPMFKGSPAHKKSVAKAKKPSTSVVDFSRMTADPTLTYMAGELGESYIPEAIDYGLRSGWADIPEEKRSKQAKKGTKKEKDVREILEEKTKPGDGSKEINVPGAKNPKWAEGVDTKKDYSAPPSSSSSKSIPVIPVWQQIKNALSNKKAKQVPQNTVSTSKNSPDFVNDPKKDGFASAANAFGFKLEDADDFVFAEDRMEWNNSTNEWQLKKGEKPIESVSIPRQNITSLISKDPQNVTLQVPTSGFEPVSSSGEVILAHDNPDYIIKEPTYTYNPERGLSITSGSLNDKYNKRVNPNGKGYEQYINDDGDILHTYNGYEINYEEIPPETLNWFTEQINDDFMEFGNINVEDKSKDIKTSDNQTFKEIKNDEEPVINIEEQKISSNIKKPNPNTSEYKWVSMGNVGGWKHGGKKRYERDLNNWKISKNQSGALQQRDDRIFRNAIKGGPVQQNMLNSGYIPPNKR